MMSCCSSWVNTYQLTKTWGTLSVFKTYKSTRQWKQKDMEVFTVFAAFSLLPIREAEWRPRGFSQSSQRLHSWLFFKKRKPQPAQSAHQTEHLKIGFLPQTQCKLSWWEKQKLKQMFLKLNQLEFLFPPFDPGDSSKNIWICVLTQIYIG